MDVRKTWVPAVACSAILMVCPDLSGSRAGTLPRGVVHGFLTLRSPEGAILAAVT